MKRDKKAPRARTLARLLGRKQDKLVSDRERLALLEPGGSAERPIVLETAAQLIIRAEGFACLRCDGRLGYLEDCVVSVGTGLRRMATLECKQCRKSRQLWFQIQARTLN